jgi:hypothetical protein
MAHLSHWFTSDFLVYPLFLGLMATILKTCLCKKPVAELSHFNPEDGGRIFFQNISICLKDYMVSQPRRLQYKKLPP